MLETDNLIAGYVKGDKKAIGALIDTYKDDLYNLCFRLTFNAFDADDLFQQTWLKATMHASKLKHSSFRAWLFRICINQYRDNYRMTMRRKMLVMDEFDSNQAKQYVLSVANSGNAVEDDIEKKQIHSRLVAEINRLPETHKVPIVLHYFQKLKYSEIAALLDIPEGTVKSRINTAKAKLKSIMEGEKHV